MSIFDTIRENVNYFLDIGIIQKLEEPFKNDTPRASTTEFGAEVQDRQDFDALSNLRFESIFVPNFSSDQNIDDLIKSYRSMQYYSYVDDAINEICHTAIIKTNDRKHPVKIDFFESKENEISEEVKTKTMEEFNTVLNLLNFNENGEDLFKQWYVDGRILIQTIFDPSNLGRGIIDTKVMSPLYLKRNYDEKEKKYFYIYDDKKVKDFSFGYGREDVVALIPDELVMFVPSGIYDTDRKVSISYLHYALKDINRLNTLEDHMLIYRIVRAPERRVFYIEQGNLPYAKAQENLNKIINMYKSKKFYDETTGTLVSKTKHPTMLEDFFLMRKDGKGTEVSVLPTVGALGDIADLVYFQKKALKALHVPFSRIFGEDSESISSPTKNEITTEEYRFNRFINHLRNKFSNLFFQLLKKQLILKNIINKETWDKFRSQINFVWADDNNFVREKRLSVMERELGVLRDAAEFESKYFTREEIFKTIRGFTDSDIEDFEKKLEEEKSKFENEDYGKNKEGGGTAGI